MKHALPLLLMTLGAAGQAVGQSYSWARLDDIGVKFRLFDKLEQVPINLDSAQPNLRARYKPAKESDYIWSSRGAYSWYLWVYEFFGDGPDIAAGAARRDIAPSFAEFVDRSVPGGERREFVVRDETVQRRVQGRKVSYRLWEYRDTQPGELGQPPITWHITAAVHDLDGREVALVTSFPVVKGDRVDAKHLRWSRTMLESLSPLSDNEFRPRDEFDLEQLHRHADSLERRQAVDDAIANIANLDNWSILTTPHYIVLYSWPSGRLDKRRRHRDAAAEIAQRMDDVRELYQRYFPPPDDLAFPYSIVRICSTSDEFLRYSDTTQEGLLGWFSPGSKELVLFLDNDLDQTMTVAFHEGWHQYSDTYFGGVELQRWFDEGAGDFFGSFVWADGNWQYDVSRMRRADAKDLVSSGSYVPLEEIVTWHRSRFYGPNAAAYYAQCYALFDFLMRGAANRAAGWDASWDGCLTRYRDSMLAEVDHRMACEAAFGEIDWERLTRAWARWVEEY